MQPITPVPTFSSRDNAMEAIYRGRLSELRTILPTEVEQWETVTFVVVADIVEFSLLAPASNDQHFTVTGFFGVDGDPCSGEIADVQGFGDEDADVEASVKYSAGGELLRDVADAWLALPEDTRHDLIRSDVHLWLESVAADAWVHQQEGHNDPVMQTFYEGRVWRAQSRATAYEMTGPAGVAARRLVTHDWTGDPVTLVATAEAEAAAGEQSA